MRGHYRHYCISVEIQHTPTIQTRNVDTVYIDGYTNQPYILTGLFRVDITRKQAADAIRHARNTSVHPSRFTISVKRSHSGCYCQVKDA